MRKLIILLLFPLLVSAQYNLFARQNFETKKSTFSYLLDDFTGASVAYSFRKLRSGYTGNCVKVKRSSDNTFLDIGFINNILDEASLLTFVGSGDGYIEKWYDQSGNGNDLIFGLYVPYKIVEAGILSTKNGKPSMNSLYNKQAYLRTASSIASSFDSVFCVFSFETTQTTSIFTIPFGWASDGDYYGLASNTSPDASASFAGYGGAIPTVYKNNITTAIVNNRGAHSTAFKIGVQVLSSSFISCPFTKQRALSYGALPAFEHVQEVIMWGTDKSSIKPDIQNNINTFYSIY